MASKAIFGVSGISCQSCVRAIEDSLTALSSFNSVQVKRSPDRLEIESSESITVDGLNRIFSENSLTKYRAHSLVDEIPAEMKANSNEKNLWQELFPLALVIGYLLLTVVVIAVIRSDFSLISIMSHYMGGFFLIFSFFKFLNLRGFVDAFHTYDPLAKAWRPYGYLYAAFELLAGIAYLAIPTSIILNSLVLMFLSISSIGVWRAVRSKSKIQCACLGTIFNLPMTKVTIVENVTMIAMAVHLIFLNFI